MTAKYWQKGEVLDYKASAAVKNGEVVTFRRVTLPPLRPAQTKTCW